MIITVEQYLADPAAALDRTQEDDGHPVLIIRDSKPGPVKPVALMIPADMEDTGAIVSALPEYELSRKHAEHARAEGRTVPAEEALATLEKMDQEATQ